MNINIFDKLQMLYDLSITIFKIPCKKIKFKLCLNPVDATRYTEFTYLLKYLKKENISLNKKHKVLDISSPYILSYYFSSFCKVIKTDLDISEKENIITSDHLSFKQENATKLSFAGGVFDVVYSISVIEHIYDDYLIAINEIIRVSKKGAIIYVTLPVSNRHVEEWHDMDIYSGQYKHKGKTFFQYRFDTVDIGNIRKEILKNADIISEDIYWESKNNGYDQLVKNLRKDIGNRYLNTLKSSLLNVYFGFFIFTGVSKSFNKLKKFGNIHLILKKR